MIQIISFDIGIKNLALCILHYDHVHTKHVEIKVWRVIDLNCKKSDAMGLVGATLATLDTVTQELMSPDMETFVIIENQMITTMKSLQTAINMYFQVMSRHVLSVPIHVEYINPRLKLKLAEHLEGYNKEPSSRTYSQKYKQNKVDSVDLAKWLLQKRFHDPDSCEFLLSNTKKDDLADSYNQAVGWALLAYKRI